MRKSVDSDLTSALLPAGLALAGLCISVFFTLRTYGVVLPGAPTPTGLNVCRRDGPSCETVVHTPAARLFAGIPNSVFGMAFYGLVLVSIACGGWDRPGWLVPLLVAAALAVGAGVYLIVQLYRVMRVSCPLCVVAHMINLLLAATFGVRLALMV